MSPRSFWLVILKIIGLYIIIEALPVIFQFLSSIMSVDFKEDSTLVVINLLLLFVSLAVYILLLRLFLFKTNWIIDRLQLEKGFTEDSFAFNMHRSTILTIAIIVIGAVLFIDSLPDLCRQIFLHVQMKKSYYASYDSKISGWIILYFAKGVIGVLLMIYTKHIVNFIELRRRNRKQVLLGTKRNLLMIRVNKISETI